MSKVIAITNSFVAGPILVSAFDVCRESLRQKSLGFATHIFLDSGGYEARDDTDLSEVDLKPRHRTNWTIQEYEEVLDNWDFDRPTVVVSYDSPLRKEKLETQIARAHRYRGKYTNAAHLILIKPEPGKVLVEAKRICSKVSQLKDFDIIGVTEKELGESALERLVAVAKIRTALSDAGVSTPIHIFGSLDPIACPLFFLAGADIFDGLTWLRYAYVNGAAMYRQNAPALDQYYHEEVRDGELSAMIQIRNYQELGRMRDRMIAFLQNGDFKEFDQHAEYFRKIAQRVVAELRG